MKLLYNQECMSDQFEELARGLICHYVISPFAGFPHQPLFSRRLDLDSANSAPNNSHWALKYGAKKAAYNLTDMSPKSWQALLRGLQSEPALLGEFLYAESESAVRL